MKRLLHWLAAAALLAATAAQAQDWPAKPIRVIVPGAAGASADALARSMAEVLGRQLGVAVVVENKVGARGSP